MFAAFAARHAGKRPLKIRSILSLKAGEGISPSQSFAIMTEDKAVPSSDPVQV
jgi:hypothetical protein